MSNITSNYVILCDLATKDETTGKISVNGIFDIIYAREFPATHPKAMLAASFRVHNPSLEQVEVSFLLLDPDQKPVELSEKSVTVAIVKQNANLDRGVNFLLNLVNIVFKTEGYYNFKVLVDGELVGTTQFRVIKVDNSNVS